MSFPGYEFPRAENPCRRKSVCQICRLAERDDRPRMCIELTCEHFTPCKGCGINTTLNVARLCTACVDLERTKMRNSPSQGVSKPVAVRKPEPEPTKPFADVPAFEDPEIEQNSPMPVLKQITEIGMPGVPPRAYGPAERDYYETTWMRYSGFYRDPSAYAVVHQLIIVEIELNVITNYLIQSRLDENNKAHERRQKELVDLLSNLRSMLPEKEADDENETDKWFSRVYEDFMREQGVFKAGRLYRILSPEAVALAPKLDFPIDAEQLLRDLGYDLASTQDAIQKFITVKGLPCSAEKLLEFLGFFLNEKYALPFVESAMTEEIWEDMEEEEERLVKASRAQADQESSADESSESDTSYFATDDDGEDGGS